MGAIIFFTLQNSQSVPIYTYHFLKQQSSYSILEFPICHIQPRSVRCTAKPLYRPRKWYVQTTALRNACYVSLNYIGVIVADGLVPLVVILCPSVVLGTILFRNAACVPDQNVIVFLPKTKMLSYFYQGPKCYCISTKDQNVIVFLRRTGM